MEATRLAKVFFSSCFDDPERHRLHIRDRLIDANGAFTRTDPASVAKLPIWMAESYAVLDPDAPTAPLTKAMICVHGVRDSDVYVAVVRSRHGSGVALSPEEIAQVSYFELELFEAALLEKPAHVFVLAGGELSPRLAALLDLLEPALPGLDRTPRTEDDIYGEVMRILAQASRPRPPASFRRQVASGRRLSDALTAERFLPYDPMSAAPGLRFLGGAGDPAAARPNLGLVEDAITRAGAQASHHDRLTLLWIAIRELMGAPIDDAGSLEALPFWERALGAWNSAGAWYGLHGHPLMGCLASLGSLADLKLRLSRPGEMPHGALSSEYYSIAKLVSRHLRGTMLETSRAHIDAAFQSGETSGKLAQRGSVRAAQGDAQGAIDDYRRVVELRRGSEQASDEQVAEGLTELGFALVFAGDGAEGLKLMEEGMNLFRGPPTGFLVRAQRKLGRAYIRAGAPKRALETLELAHDTAIATGSMDQISRIDQLAAAISKQLGLARSRSR